MDFYVVLERPGYRVARRRKCLAKASFAMLLKQQGWRVGWAAWGGPLGRTAVPPLAAAAAAAAAAYRLLFTCFLRAFAPNVCRWACSTA